MWMTYRHQRSDGSPFETFRDIHSTFLVWLNNFWFRILNYMYIPDTWQERAKINAKNAPFIYFCSMTIMYLMLGILRRKKSFKILKLAAHCEVTNYFLFIQICLLIMKVPTHVFVFRDITFYYKNVAMKEKSFYCQFEYQYVSGLPFNWILSWKGWVRFINVV